MKILQNRLRFSVGVQYKPSTVIRRLVGAGGARAVCERNTCDEQVHGAAELLANAVYGRQARAPGGIHLRFLAISIIFGANIRCVYILLVIFVILHRKNEHLFGGVHFG